MSRKHLMKWVLTFRLLSQSIRIHLLRKAFKNQCPINEKGLAVWSSKATIAINFWKSSARSLKGTPSTVTALKTATRQLKANAN